MQEKILPLFKKIYKNRSKIPIKMIISTPFMNEKEEKERLSFFRKLKIKKYWRAFKGNEILSSL